LPLILGIKFNHYLRGIIVMYKKTGIGDSVASEMDRILNDSNFQSKFEPMVVTASVEEIEEDEGYNAFMRFAKKKDKEEEVEEDPKKSKSSKKKEEKEEKENGKGKKGKFPFFEKGKGKGKGKKEEEEEEPKKGKGKAKKDKKAEAQALEYIIASISQTSEVLDNLGLEKSATNALSLLSGIIREASIKQAEEDPELMEALKSRVDNSEPFEFVSFEDEDDFQEPDGSEAIELSNESEEIPTDMELDISDDPISEDLGDDLIFNKEVVALTRELENWIKK
jgi:hypothetical protein